MAMTYQNFASLGVNLNRQKYGPLDISNVFTSAADLKYYLSKGTFTEGVSEYWYKNANEKIVPYPYEGQVLATVIDGVVSVYALSLDAEGNFQTQEIGAKVEVDGTTIVKDADGKLSIVAPVDPASDKTYNFAYANGVYSWVEVDTATAAGQAQEINSLKSRASALEDTVNGTEGKEGLVAKVAALEAVDNATQDELDAYKEVVTAAIAAGVKEAKDYADAQDADTIYDDTALAARVKAIEDDYLVEADKYDDTDVKARIKAIEDDYLKTEDKYDDTALAGRVTTAEGKIADLEAAVEAIDYVDADELATELAPYAKSADVESALADKADKTALEDLKSTVDAFLTGDGTEAALDSLKELIEYIKTHDDVEISGILENIQAIENKLAGIDSTVAAYVTAAIDALKIGDYAKASDLTDLAGRVEALEAKPFDTYATKTEVADVDAKFAQYTTTTDLNGLLANKADADSVVANDTFTQFKADNSTAIATAKQEAIDAAKAAEEAKGYAVAADVAGTYATKTALSEAVEGIENDLLAYAKTEDVEDELAKKIETATIAHTSETKSEGITKNGTQLDIVVDAYTKAETLAKIDEKITSFTGGESAKDVLNALNTYKETNNSRVGAIETKNGEQDTAIATAQAQADKGVADAAAVAADVAALDVRVVSNTNEIGVVKGTISTVNETLSGKITTLENADTKFTSDITALQGIVSGEGGHASRITALEGRATNLEAKDTELAALIQANTDKFAGYYTKSEVDTKVQEAIDAIPDVDFTGYATETYVDDAIAALDVDNKLAAKVDNTAFETYKSETATLIGTKANAADVYTKTEADAEFMTEGEVDARINALINAADPEGGKTISDIQNLVKYVEENAGEISGLVTTVGDHTKAIADNVTAIASNKAAHEKNASDIAALQGVVGDHATAIAKNTEDIGKINNAIAAIVQPKASDEVTVADDGTLGLGEVSTDKLVQGSETLVLNGGSAV